MCAVADAETCTDVLTALDTPELQPRRRRLVELRDASVSHDWL